MSRRPSACRDLERRVALDGEAEGRDAAVHGRRAVQAAAIGQPGEEALAERPLLRVRSRPTRSTRRIRPRRRSLRAARARRCPSRTGDRAATRARGAPCTGASAPAAPFRRTRGRGAARRTCRASRAGRRRRGPRRRSAGARRSGRRRPRRARRRAWASSTMRAASVSVPTAFEASGNATTRVRSESCASRSARSMLAARRRRRRSGRRGRGRGRARARARCCRRGRDA